MGTRSRIIIKRKNKDDLYFWAHYDGYYSYMGNKLCENLKLLLENYNINEIINNIYLIHDNYLSCNDFSPYDLDYIIMNKDNNYLNNCDDFIYIYTIDFENKYIKGVEVGESRIKLSFNDILNGYIFTDCESDLE